MQVHVQPAACVFRALKTQAAEQAPWATIKKSLDGTALKEKIKVCWFLVNLP